jgi:hypothetical protein
METPHLGRKRRIQVVGVCLFYIHGLLEGGLLFNLPVTMRPATIGIVSIGDMGLGMARLLKSHNYRVVTVAEGRRYGQLRHQTKPRPTPKPRTYGGQRAHDRENPLSGY